MLAVVTMEFSPEARPVGEITIPRMVNYARRCGADFIVRSVRVRPEIPIYWERLALADLFGLYERILILDLDVLVRADAPNLFDIVPADHVGMANEGQTLGDPEKALRNANIQAYHVHLDLPYYGWNGRYYNVGVMLVPRVGRALLDIPDDLWHGHWNEQCLISGRIHHQGTAVFDIGSQFNYMQAFDPGLIRCLDAYMIHYAGRGIMEHKTHIIMGDDQAWRKHQL